VKKKEEEKIPEPNLPFDVNGSRVAGAVLGAGTGALQGMAFGAFMRPMGHRQSALAATPIGKLAASPMFSNRHRTILMFAGGSAVMGAMGAEKIRKKMAKYDSFMHAEGQSTARGIVEGPVAGAALLGGVLGVGSGVRHAFASKMMGHSNATALRVAGKNIMFGSSGRKPIGWLPVGLVGGAALGAVSLAIQTDPKQTWGTMTDSLTDKRSAKWCYGIFGGGLGGLLGLSAFMASKSPKAGAVAALKGAAVFGSLFYAPNAVYRMTTTGIHAAGGANKKWSE
jgi:hypothetical protein